MDKREKFEKIYQNIIDTNIFDMEKYRNEARIASIKRNDEINKIIIFCVVTVIVLVVSMTVLSIVLGNMALEGNTSTIIQIIFATIFLISIGVFGICKTKVKVTTDSNPIVKYDEEFKHRIIKDLIKSFNKGFEYEPYKGIARSVYEQAEFRKFESYRSEDLVYGKISNGCKLTMSEVNTWVETDDKYINIFGGLFIIIEMPKQFQDKIYIREDKRKVSFGNLKIRLDSKEFEDIFDVYASNQMKAMQLLTADVMQILVDFYKETDLLFEITIKDNRIYMEFACGKLFETPDLEEFSLEKEPLYQYYRILDFALEMANMLAKLVNDTQYE